MVHQSVPFPANLKPAKINIPTADAPVKPGHKREHSSPNSVTCFESDVCSPKADVKEEIFSPRHKHLPDKAAVWRCVSPTDQLFRVEQPSVCLKKAFVKRFLTELPESRYAAI